MGMFGREVPVNPPVFFYKDTLEWKPIPVTYWQMHAKPFYFRSLPIKLNKGQNLNPRWFWGKDILFMNLNGEKRMFKAAQAEPLMDGRFFVWLEEN